MDHHIRAGTTTNKNNNNNSAAATIMMGPSSSNHNRDDDKKKFSSSSFFAAAWSTPLLRNQFGAHPAANKPRFVHSASLHHHHHNHRSSKTPRRSSPDSALALFRVQLPTRMVMTTAAVFLLLPLLLFFWKEMGIMMHTKNNRHGKLLADMETADAAHRLRQSRHKQAQPAWMEEGILTTTTTDQDSGRTNTSNAATIISGNETTTTTMATTLRKKNLTSSTSSGLPTSLAFDADNHTRTTSTTSKSSKSSKEAVILSSTDETEASVNAAPDAITQEPKEDTRDVESSDLTKQTSVINEGTVEHLSSPVDPSSTYEGESSIQQEESGSKSFASSETSKSSKTTTNDSLKDENEDEQEQLDGKSRRDSAGEAKEVDPAGNRTRRRLIRQRRHTLANSTRTFQ